MSGSAACLRASRVVLKVLLIANLLLGVTILGLLIASWLAEEMVMTALGVRAAAGSADFISGMKAVMLVGIASVPLAYVVLQRLLAIADTVGLGDPFVAANARRLKAIAWALLGLQLLQMVAAAVAAAVSSDANTLRIEWPSDVAGWLAVLLLFVLAGIFDHGTRMRDDLEGTV